jgi:hypothetical protein
MHLRPFGAPCHMRWAMPAACGRESGRGRVEQETGFRPQATGELWSVAVVARGFVHSLHPCHMRWAMPTLLHSGSVAGSLVRGRLRALSLRFRPSSGRRG